jgi:hypothetical protein
MRKLLTYALLIGIFASLTWFVIEKGNLLVRPSMETSGTSPESYSDKTKPVVIDSRFTTFMTSPLLDLVDYSFR